MNIYHYDPITRKYMGCTDARLDPLELKMNNKEIFLVPANATNDAPPDAPEGMMAVMDGGWKLIPIPAPEEDVPEDPAVIEERERVAQEAAGKIRLVEIDLKSIRSLREWVVAQPDAPQFIIDYETQAISERKKLQK